MSFPLLASLSNTVSLHDVFTNYDLVLEIQTLLKLGHFYKGDIDGFWGTKTDAAFKAFKTAAYLEFPNELGSTTAKALLEIAGQGQHPPPKDGWIATGNGRELNLPGGRTVKTNDLIPGCYNFTWGEATALGSRKPEDSNVVTRIIQLAAYMDRVKACLNGKPIVVTSWYRPKEINDRVGGVRNSIHLQGGAVDFICRDIPPLEVYRILDKFHGRLGGLGRSPQFTHLDLRGYPARWEYGHS